VTRFSPGYNAAPIAGFGDGSAQGSKRPRGLRLVCAAFLAIGIVHLVTAVRGLQFGAAYEALGVSFSPLAQVIFSLIWAVAFPWMAWRMWRRRNRTWRWVFFLVVGYGLAQAAWWRIFTQADYAVQRWPFAVLMTALGILLVVWVLNRPSARAWIHSDGPGTSRPNNEDRIR